MTTTALDRIDDTAQLLAQAALDGELDGKDARAQMCALLMRAQVCESVAFSRPGLSTQQQHDLAENLLSTLADRVMDPESSFDLARIAHGSLCGWARMLGMKVSIWDRAVRPRGVDAITVRVDPIARARTADGCGAALQSSLDYGTAAYHAAQAFGGLSPEDEVLSEWGDSEQMSNALDRASSLTGFAREPIRDRAGAAALREVFRLPALCVPDRPAERATILALVIADETLARRALVQMAAMVCAEPPSLPPRGEAPVGELLLSLWDDFDPDHLESLMVRPAKAAHMIVVDALTPMPKPSRETVRALTRAVRSASITKDWAMAQDGLVAAYLATCTEAVSRFDDTNDAGAKTRKQGIADEAAARWPGLAARAAAFAGAPLGKTAEMVGARMGDLLADARGKDTDDRIAARHRRGLGLDPAGTQLEEAA